MRWNRATYIRNKILVAIHDGFRVSPFDLAEYLRKEDEPIPENIREHIAKALEDYPWRNTKGGRCIMRGRPSSRPGLNNGRGSIEFQRRAVRIYIGRRYELEEEGKRGSAKIALEEVAKDNGISTAQLRRWASRLNRRQKS